MDGQPSFQLTNLLSYWRNTLADEDLMGLDGASSPVRTSPEAVDSGRLDKDSVEALQRAWNEYKRQASWNQTAADLAAPPDASIPIIILAKGYAPQHEHGKPVGDRDSARAYYTLHIPATLSHDGALSSTEHSSPWIGREYLRPNEAADEKIPLVGELATYDTWLNENPLDETSWETFMRWCDGLWGQVIGENVPEGFVPLPDVRIDISKSVRNAGRHLCQLYDALQAEQEFPALLKRLCTGHTAPTEVDAVLRIRQLASARGTMSTAYGLADSQADAVSAFTALESGELLAVNGPPGTGKTTLLQSIIATEVVARAIAGGEPAVIVGSSTNNQAVVNINRSLNEIFQENPALSQFPWARRWVPEADTYGLYLPAGEDKANEAVENGYAVALKDRSQWNGFPEREIDPDYLAQAESLWSEGHKATYGATPETVEAGLERLRADLTHISREMQTVQGCLERHQAITQWWHRTAGEVLPQAHLEMEDVSLSAAIDSAAKDLQSAEHAADKAKAVRDSVHAKADEATLNAKETYASQQAHMRKLAGIKAKINAALAPHGLLETLAEALQIFRSTLSRKQLSRLCMLAAEDPLISELFETQIHANDSAAWTTRSDWLIQEGSAEIARLRNEQSAQAQRREEEIAVADRNLAAAFRERDRAAGKVAEARQHRSARLSLLREKIRELDERTKELCGAHETLRRRAVSEFLIPAEKAGAPDMLPSVRDFDVLLDVTWRHMAFQKAMRYWEGRWILEARAVQKEQVNTNNGRAAMEARFRRWCMLTPCLIVTVHSLPKHFRFTSHVGGDNPFVSNFMLGFIDLLIVDEAGQVGPHVGAAAFSLASRAVVVGDIYQIEPVSKVSRGTDYANSSRMGLHGFWKDGDPASPHLVCEPRDGSPQGSIMRLAQLATTAVSPETEQEPGIFLTEHRRCRKEIVEYCNRLVYKGRLQPLSPSRQKAPPLPPMAWAHVRGTARKVGNSRANSQEAASIAGWIAANAETWCQHYDKPIEEIVAVVTPFRPQSRLVKEALGRADRQYANITVGTVHALQGAEKPIVVFSPTYNADTVKGMFFDRKPNMLNVAVSRAKDSFVVIGDMRLFRRKGRSPSAILGQMLFTDEQNELPDVDGNHRFTRELLVQAERISTLDRHREVLRNALEGARSGQTVLIASPWITMKAVNDDDLSMLVTAAVGQRGAQVWVVVDRELSTQRPEHRGGEALELLRQAGATICAVNNMHNKTLINGPSEITEGSFNWLSAQRQRGDRFIRYEASWRIAGASAAGAVQSALDEFAKLGVPLCIAGTAELIDT